MQSLYIDFLEILEQYMPDAKEAFGLPVNEDLLNELEQKFENKLPEEFLEFYKMADGEKNIIGSILGFTLMPIETMKQEYDYFLHSEIMIEAYQKEKIREGKYNAMWLPIAGDGGGSCLIMDMAPGVDGVFGQIITLDIERNKAYVIAQSFKELLLEVIPQALEDEDLAVDDEEEPEMFVWSDGHYFNNIKKRME